MLFFILLSKFSFSQTPCYEIRNHTACTITISWETVDGTNAHLDGANPVTILPYSSLYISGSACSGAADIYVYLFTVNGATTNQVAPVNGVITPTNPSESGSASTQCNGGVWHVDYGGAVIHIY